MYQVGINKGIILRCTAYQISRFIHTILTDTLREVLSFRAVLYGCETWLLTMREKRRLRVFEDSVLRRIFGVKRDGVKGEWRKLHNEELNP